MIPKKEEETRFQKCSLKEPGRWPYKPKLVTSYFKGYLKTIWEIKLSLIMV
jgi:hypothetical protein